MTTKFYTDCDNCEGEGGVSVYCCRGYDDIGNPDCGCHGQGDWQDCDNCNGTGKVPCDDIEWNFDTLDEVDRHDYQVYYSIEGIGKNGKYIATAIYTHGAFDTLEDIVLLPCSGEDYKSSQEFTDLKKLSVHAKTLVPGRTYYTKLKAQRELDDIMKLLNEE